MTKTVKELVLSWRAEAEVLRHRYGADALAKQSEVHAQELETAMSISLDEELTLEEAAHRSGYSKSHLRRLMDSGTIENVGRPGRPRVMLRDLPYRAGRMAVARALQVAQGRGDDVRSVRRVSPG